MALFDWDESFELGMEPFDRHHIHLVHLLNKAHDNYINRADNAALGAMLDQLVEYMTHHFAAEEKWMSQNGYDGLQLHRREHYEFSMTVAKFQKEYHEGKSQLSSEIFSFLKNWLFDHILKTDADYGEFARKCRVRTDTGGS